MKELTIEQKAKAYDSMFERLEEMYNNNKTNVAARLKYERYFPELKESEESKDEKIRKTILSHFKSAKQWVCSNGVSKEQVLAWLEKQGEHANFRNKIQIGDKVTRNEDGVLVNLSQLNRVAKKDEKQGEQNHTDKVKTKFHEGDWVILTAGELSTTLQIVKVDTNKKLYWFNDSSYLPIVDEECLHFWTIQDAKDGDVVVDKSDGTIGIFQSIGSHPDGGCYNDPSYCFLHCHCDDEFFYADFENGNEIDSDDLVTATKEQRDLLFEKMKEAGYEWDAEKKELRKIEQKPVPKFKVGDVVRSSNGVSLLIVGITDYCYNCVTCATNDEYSFGFDIQDEFELVEQKPTEWSEEDEALLKLSLENLTELKDRFGKEYGRVGGCIDWLKSLKERMQPDKGWIPIKESFYTNNVVLAQKKDKSDVWEGYTVIADHTLDPLVFERYINIENISTQSLWKPDSSMLICLEYAIKHINKDGDKRILSKLLEQLKKLKKE